MRMPAITAEQREARRVLKGVLEEARPLVEGGRAAYNDAQLDMEGTTRAFFASGDTAQINRVMSDVSEILEACEAALPVLEQFEENFALAPAFDRIARRFLSEGESPETLQFYSDYEAIRWLADRVLAYAQHADLQLLPWLKTALGEIRGWIVKRQEVEDRAPDRVEAACRRLEEVRAAHPTVQWVRATNRLAEAESALKAMEEARAIQHHKGVVDAAQAAITAADGAERSIEEGLGLMKDANARLLEAEDMLTQLGLFYSQRSMAQPEPMHQARQLLQQAREKAAQQPPAWAEAIMAYNQASELYEIAASGVGEVAA
jgi:hypothetical protein